jgi:hypothetical protein
VLVCDETDDELEPVLEVEAWDSRPSPDSPDSPDSRDVVPELRVFELAAVWVVEVVVCPSCQARTPPSESIVATLRAVTALRARAARGLRRGRGVGVEIRSSMTVKVRRGGERAARAR